MKPLFLMLEDGAVFEGTSVDSDVADCEGLLSFDTSTAGFERVVTDPANMGKIIVFPSPLTGGAGIDRKDAESSGPKAAGAIVGRCAAHLCGGLAAYLGSPRLALGHGFDTRAIMRHLRRNGEMKATLTAKEVCERTLSRRMDAIGCPDYEPENRPLPCRRAKAGAAVLDLGASKSFFRALAALKVRDGLNPNEADLVIVSDAPYYTVEDSSVISQVTGWFGRKPVLGFGHGAAIVARACGARVSWLQVGHHGTSVPVRAVSDGRCRTTEQNHNYTVSPNGGLASLFNDINDGACEGFVCSDARAAGVHFVPDEQWFGAVLASIGVEYKDA